MKFPTREALQGYVREDWAEHLEWILSKDVYGAAIKHPTSGADIRPAWSLVLDFELMVRRRAMKLLNADPSRTLKQALKMAREDNPLTQRYFLTPATLAAGVAVASGHKGQPAASSGGYPAQRALANVPHAAPKASPAQGVKKPKKRRSGKAQKSKKGGSKGSGKSGLTPDGRQKCYGYQNGRCKGPTCPQGRVHACLRCNGPHLVSECPQPGN